MLAIAIMKYLFETPCQFSPTKKSHHTKTADDAYTMSCCKRVSFYLNCFPAYKVAYVIWWCESGIEAILSSTARLYLLPHIHPPQSNGNYISKTASAARSNKLRLISSREFQARPSQPPGMTASLP